MCSTRQGPLIVQDGEPLNITCQLIDFQSTFYDEATETIINGRAQQGRLSEVAADGHFTIKLDTLENTIINPSLGSNQLETHPCSGLAMERWNPGANWHSSRAVPSSANGRLGDYQPDVVLSKSSPNGPEEDSPA